MKTAKGLAGWVYSVKWITTHGIRDFRKLNVVAIVLVSSSVFFALYLAQKMNCSLSSSLEGFSLLALITLVSSLTLHHVAEKSLKNLLVLKVLGFDPLTSSFSQWLVLIFLGITGASIGCATFLLQSPSSLKFLLDSAFALVACELLAAVPGFVLVARSLNKSLAELSENA